LVESTLGRRAPTLRPTPRSLALAIQGSAPPRCSGRNTIERRAHTANCHDHGGDKSQPRSRRSRPFPSAGSRRNRRRWCRRSCRCSRCSCAGCVRRNRPSRSSVEIQSTLAVDARERPRSRSIWVSRRVAPLGSCSAHVPTTAAADRASTDSAPEPYPTAARKLIGGGCWGDGLAGMDTERAAASRGTGRVKLARTARASRQCIRPRARWHPRPRERATLSRGDERDPRQARPRAGRDPHRARGRLPLRPASLDDVTSGRPVLG
jgi:hypothetical protein